MNPAHSWQLFTEVEFYWCIGIAFFIGLVGGILLSRDRP